MLGLEVPNATTLTQNFVALRLRKPASRGHKGLNDSNVGALSRRRTQIWKIVHNGVDSHIYHFHLYNVQLINRVGWDGVMVPPDANELGWRSQSGRTRLSKPLWRSDRWLLRCHSRFQTVPV